ncbi:MAG: hypothetical protein JSS62_02975 [Verrucomicrobia bacterium]|nr:hypothetical protein [Verrucomicrobiota bacterium]MBS0646377.1 hypothetical protein [Verrucomicrobiota bacterium]
MKGGVHIGHGSIIAAGAVVVKDVPAYSIVAGNPAKVVKMRFDVPTIEKLLHLAWWDWELTKINRCLPLICNMDVEALEKASREKI